MRQILLLGLVLTMSLAARGQMGAGAAPKKFSPFAEELIDNEKALTAAQQKRDVEYLQKTFADDFVEAGVDGQLHDRGEVLGDAYEVNLKEYTPYNIEVVPLSESAGVVTYDVIVGMAKYDEEIPRYQRVSSVWMKLDGTWRLKFQQATPHVF